MTQLLQRLQSALRGHYTVEKEVGRGGMATVYLGRDLKHERSVALKVFDPELGAAIGRDRFLQEIMLIARLQHPHILPLYDSGEVEGILYFVMPFIEGRTLRDRLNTEKTLPIDDAVRITCEVAEALAHAHASGVVHRDIKPENILFSGGHALVSDFGVARALASSVSERLTQTGLVLGTPAYMSPEQVCSDPVIAGASDLYSLGCVLYEMLTGKPPFTGATAQALISQHVIAAVPALRAARAGVPEQLELAVTKVLAKSPDDRFATAAEFINTLQAARVASRTDDGIRYAHGGQTGARSDNRTNNLPAQLTALVGREKEVTAARRLLGRGDVRLLTLTGPGGTGKSRLALRVAENMLTEFEHGVFLVTLAAISDPGLVPATIARTIGVREEAHQPIAESLKLWLREKRMLLLLDNFEQVVSAAPLVIELLAASSDLKALVTSRVVLRVSGEYELPVPPLEVPNLRRLPARSELSRSPAVELFVQRARAVRPDFALTDENAPSVAEICVRLDGLPLAIELAAARCKLLPPRGILTRLESRLRLLTGGGRDAPARHQTLREAIGWSYDLLSDSDKTLFRRLSVFVGGCTLDAVEGVCNAPGESAIDVLEGVASLVDKSLLLRDNPGAIRSDDEVVTNGTTDSDAAADGDGEPRFRMLETIREFGLELLAAGEATTLRDRHRDWFVRFAEEAEPRLTGSEQAVWLERLERDHDNLRSALEWSETASESDTVAARLASALWRFWVVRGYLTEGRERLERLLARPAAVVDPHVRAQILTGAGTLAQNQGDYAAAHARFSESLLLYREVVDERGIATALNNLGWVAWRQGEYDAAESLSDEALALHRGLGDKRGIAISLNNLGWIAHHRGDFSRAQSFHEQCMALRRELGDERGIGFSLTNLAWALSRQGDYSTAVPMLENALDIFREVGDRQLYAFSLTILADTLHRHGEHWRAASLLEESVPLARQLGARYTLGVALATLGSVVREQGDRARALLLLEESLRVRQAMGDRYGTADSLARIAEMLASSGELERAAELYTESIELRRALGDKDGVESSLAGLSDLASKRAPLKR